jgi:hypothetical protein
LVKNISSPAKLIDEDKEVQSSLQEKEAQSANLGKADDPVSQIGCFSFDTIETDLNKVQNDDPCEFDLSIESTSSTSSRSKFKYFNCPMAKGQREHHASLIERFDDLSDDDSCATNSSSYVAQLEMVNKVLMGEFEELITKHKKLQERHSKLLCSHEKLIDSYAMLATSHEFVLIVVKSYQSHTSICAPKSINLSCANSCCSQTMSSCDEHAIVETCDNLIASENDDLKREVEMLKLELSRLKGKEHVQLYQDNRDSIVNKLEKGSTVTCSKLPLTNLTKTHHKSNKSKIKKKPHAKCFECSINGTL